MPCGLKDSLLKAQTSVKNQESRVRGMGGMGWVLPQNP